MKKKKNFTGRGRWQGSLGALSPDITGNTQKFPGETVSGVVLFKCRGVTGDAAGRWAQTWQCQSEKLCSSHFFAPDNWQFGVSPTLFDLENMVM